MKNLLAYIGQHPAEILLWSAVVASACMVLALIIEGFRVWRQHVEQQDDRARFERIMRANGESKPWPTRPGPKGGPWRGGRAA